MHKLAQMCLFRGMYDVKNKREDFLLEDTETQIVLEPRCVSENTFHKFLVKIKTRCIFFSSSQSPSVCMFKASEGCKLIKSVMYLMFMNLN